MITYPEVERKNVRFIAFNLFIFFTATYLLTYSGSAIVDVSQLRIEVAKSLVEGFDMAVPIGMGLEGVDGRDYSWFGPGSVLMVLPFYIIGKFAGIPPENIFDIVILLVGVSTVAMVFLFSIYLGYSSRASLITAIFYGLGTMAWYYSKDSGDHGIETFFVLLSVYFMYRHSMGKQVAYLILSALSIGFAFITRPNSMLIMPSLFIMMVLHNSKEFDFKTSIRLLIRNSVLFSLSFLPFIGLILWYNYYRFGSVFETGFGLMAERLGVDFFTGTPLLTGLLGFLASPVQGFFYYSPVAILFFFSIRSFSRRHPITALSFIVIMISYLLFYAKNEYWHGASGWGPRYIFAITPFLIIPIAELFDSPIWSTKKFLRLLVSILFAISLIIQLASVSVHHKTYYLYLQVEENVTIKKVSGEGVQPIFHPPSEIYFNWRMSPILANFKFIREFYWNMRGYRYIEPKKEASPLEKIKTSLEMNVFDFWWLDKYYIEGSYLGFVAALSLFLISLFSATRIFRAVN